MTQWEEICDYLFNHEDCKHIHKIGWPSEGWIYITTSDMQRIRIDTEWDFFRVYELVQKLLPEEDY